MSPVLQVIAQRYRNSRAGKRADATRDIIFTLPSLLKLAKCETGEERYGAIRALEGLEVLKILTLKRQRPDGWPILQVRLSLESVPAFFEHLGETAPQNDREALAAIFDAAREKQVPARYRRGWDKFCQELSVAAHTGASVQPFYRTKPLEVQNILKALPAILGWEGESLMRFASISIFGYSKILEHYRSQIETCLSRLTEGKITKLGDLGILDNERSFLIHGPIKLIFDDGEINLQCLEYPARLGIKDIRRAKLVTSASRCLTVENTAMLNEIAKLRSGIILASSGSEGGYANSATVDFLKNLPEKIDLWHFGDSDPKGFDILRDLRKRTQKAIQSLHMVYRPTEKALPLSSDDKETIESLLGSEDLTEIEKADVRKVKASGMKGAFEQENLGRPKTTWPFYGPP